MMGLTEPHLFVTQDYLFSFPVNRQILLLSSWLPALLPVPFWLHTGRNFGDWFCEPFALWNLLPVALGA
jgi:hypothetical protein